MQVTPLPDAEPVHEALALEPEPEPQRLYLHMPIDVRSVSLAAIALMLSIFMLHWASAVFIPLLLGVMASYALSPAVQRMQRWRIPRAIGAAVLLTAIVCGFGSMLYSLSDDATALVDSLPDAAHKLREADRAAALQHQGLSLGQHARSGGSGGSGGTGDGVLFITFFLLASGDSFRR
jgi:predicted PurR-regulated permease PerM